MIRLIRLKTEIRHVFLCLLSQISPQYNYSYRYWRVFGKKLNLRYPETFNEKIIWLELNDYQNNPLVIQCCDKYLVREYVTKCGCADTLIDQLGTWEKVSEIPWEQLPNQFVLKWNFGAGFNIICSDKTQLNIKESQKKLISWEKKKYWLWYGEKHYKYVPKRIVCEKYIPAVGGNGKNTPDDYKFYCFHGRVKYILVCMNRKGMHADYVFFDTNWNLQPFSKYAVQNKEKIKLKCPPMINKAIDYSEKLSKDIPFVRVDWYMMEECIYFGEMTFTPCGGMDDDLLEGDKIMGQLLQIPS